MGKKSKGLNRNHLKKIKQRVMKRVLAIHRDRQGAKFIILTSLFWIGFILALIIDGRIIF